MFRLEWLPGGEETWVVPVWRRPRRLEALRTWTPFDPWTDTPSKSNKSLVSSKMHGVFRSPSNKTQGHFNSLPPSPSPSQTNKLGMCSSNKPTNKSAKQTQKPFPNRKAKRLKFWAFAHDVPRPLPKRYKRGSGPQGWSQVEEKKPLACLVLSPAPKTFFRKL